MSYASGMRNRENFLSLITAVCLCLCVAFAILAVSCANEMRKDEAQDEILVAKAEATRWSSAMGVLDPLVECSPTRNYRHRHNCAVSTQMYGTLQVFALECDLYEYPQCHLVRPEQ